MELNLKIWVGSKMVMEQDRIEHSQGNEPDEIKLLTWHIYSKMSFDFHPLYTLYNFLGFLGRTYNAISFLSVLFVRFIFYVTTFHLFMHNPASRNKIPIPFTCLKYSWKFKHQNSRKNVFTIFTYAKYKHTKKKEAKKLKTNSSNHQ